MSLILPVYGKNMEFSEKELISILEDYYSNNSLKMRKIIKKQTGPCYGQPFEVDVKSFKMFLFTDKRSLKHEEYIRKYIIKALKEVELHPEKYPKRFKTFIPRKKWSVRSLEDFQEYLYDKDAHIADWVEQSLEWAQRLSNGESWNTLCKRADTQYWYRLVMWDEKYCRKIGGASKVKSDECPTHISKDKYEKNHPFTYAVPLLVFNKW